MRHFQLCLVLFGFGFITLTNSQCLSGLQTGPSCVSFSNSSLVSNLTCLEISTANVKDFKGFTDAVFDLYNLLGSKLDLSAVTSFMNSSRAGNPPSGSLSDADFARLWFQLKISPYLSSLSKETLSCLNHNSLTCKSFQALVKELSTHIGPERKKMVFETFIKPFLNGSHDCTNNTSDSEWLKLNFQAFSSIATLEDFKTLKPNFNGMSVINHLSPEQRSQLMFDLLESDKSTSDSITQILGSFLQDLQNKKLNLTGASSSETVKNLTDFLALLKPLGRFIRSSIAIVENKPVSRDNVTKLISLMRSSFPINETNFNTSTFNISRQIDWGQHVITPLAMKYLLANQSISNIAAEIIHIIFAPETKPAEPVEVCKVTSNNSSCLITQTTDSVAKAMKCLASSNLNITEENLQHWITALTKQLQTSTTNSSSPLSSLTAAFSELPAESLTSGNLADVKFMKFWFQTKMIPLLPTVPREFLSCLSGRDFSCQVYREIVGDLSNNTGLMGNRTQQLVYTYFIQQFLSRRQNTSTDCASGLTSTDYLRQNFGSFSSQARLQDLYNLGSNFSALDALPLLSREQLNDLVFIPSARSGDRNEIMRRVFDFLLLAPNRDKLNNFLPSLQSQARKANLSCENYRTISERVDVALSSLAPNQSEDLLKYRDSLMMIPPDGCIERSDQCASTPVNETAICASVNSSALDQFLHMSVKPPGSLTLCNFTVVQFACLPMVSGLTPQHVADILACRPSSNVTKETWKLFFTKVSTQLDEALQIYSNMTPSHSNIPPPNVLDVIFDVLIDRLSPQRLEDPVFIGSLFQGRLKPFLPSLSEKTLSCLSTKNLSCGSYRSIFAELDNKTGHLGNSVSRLVYTNFARPFLLQQKRPGTNCTSGLNSTEFIRQIFGSLSSFATLQDFYNLSSSFVALDALPLLSREQLNDLVFIPSARSGDRNEIMRRVFDFLLLAPNRDKLNNFLPSLQSQARKANLSCENYRTIFERVDVALSSLAPNKSEDLLKYRDSLMMIPPDGCIERSAQCASTPVNETAICASVNSSALDQFLHMSGTPPGSLTLCNFTVVQFACLPMVSGLTPQHVADILACKPSSNVTKETWKLFFTKVSTQLDEALQIYSNMTPSPSHIPSSNVLDVIFDVLIDRLSPQRLRDPVFIGSLFQGRLKPFLTSLSQGSLSCLSTKNLTCESYHRIVQGFVSTVPHDGQDLCKPLESTPASRRQDLIYKEFINAFLSRNKDDLRCLTANSTQWLVRNFGVFSQSASLKTLQTLNKNFSAIEVLPLLTVRQLSEFAATPGTLMDPPGVNNVLKHVKDCQLGAFFDTFSPAVQNISLTQDVKAALIRQIFDRANLSNANTSNEEVIMWINGRIQPLVNNLTDSLVNPFFKILSTRDCNVTQITVKLLDGVRPTMPINTKNAIYQNILQSLKGPQPLRCYQNNSFITFLNESLLGFGQLPNVTTFLSLIPPARRVEIVNTIAPSQLGKYLSEPNVVDSDTEICLIFKNLHKTPEFLENVELPDSVKRSVLPCVWPMAVSSDNQTEIDLWFDRRLKSYLKFLNKAVLGSSDTLNATCMSFIKMVNVLGNTAFNASQLSSEDIYNTTIKTYLKTDSNPKCFKVSDTRLNSTSWFVNFIGVNFIRFVSIDDLYSFGPENQMRLFSVNTDNIRLFNQSGIPKTVLSRYTELLFLENPKFDLFSLPSALQCDAPAAVFTGLRENETNAILGNFKKSCSDVDPQISAALVSNIKTIDASAIQNMGQESVGLTTVQINKASPSVLISGLSTLSNVVGWSVAQAQAIITGLFSGNFQLNTASSLLNLGSLIGGIPSGRLVTIAPEQVLETSRFPAFVKSLLAAPNIIQMTFVNQIIKVSSVVSDLLKNVPSEMALQIPRNLLNIPPNLDEKSLKEFNRKKWKPEQAVLFFDSVANAFNNSDDLSVEVLQGFTCSRVQTFTQEKVKGLIKACRHRPGRSKVRLSESQLTCMYNRIKPNGSLDFDSYPKEMLLYYNYGQIPKANCSSYFTAVGTADFSVLSNELQGKRDTLLSNAKSCLNYDGKKFKKLNLAVLGNLACFLDKDSILNSDPEILENIKNCKDITTGQAEALGTVLSSGLSKYGSPTNWNQKTLNDLGNLPLYFTKDIWGKFKQNDLNKFLKTFLKSLRTNKTPKVLMRRLFTALIPTSTRTRRAEPTCTGTNITSTDISSESFPIGFNPTQFKACLSPSVANDNLASLCEKVDDEDYQRIVLDKLKEISPSGLSESQVKVLGPVSRVATADEIRTWNITTSDTLAALMNSDDGDWNHTQSKEIITKYLSANNNLTTIELNIVKGPNLCSLNASTLRKISSDSIKGADALDLSTCSSDNKKELFSIAKTAFPIPFPSGDLSAYQLMESYLGGADLAYIKNLTAVNVSMSLATFMKLDESVATNLTVYEVKGLLGLNLEDLKTYENQTLVRSWISKQLQSDLDILGISLTGGRTNTTAPITTAPATGSGATGIRVNEWSFSFTILLLIFTLIKEDFALNLM